MHEYAHLVVARHFGACGFVTVVRIAVGDSATIGWHGRFQLSGELNDDEWRIVAIAGTVAEWIDARAACDARSLFESAAGGPASLGKRRAPRLRPRTDEVERCVRIVKLSWPEIETQAAERAASIAANQLPRRASPKIRRDLGSRWNRRR